MPVPDHVYQWLRQLPDVMIFIGVVYHVVKRTLKGRGIPLIGGHADGILLVFVLSAIVSLIANPGIDHVIGLANLKALLRYVLIVYLLLMIAPRQSQRIRIVRWVMVAVGVQAAVGVIQYFGGPPVHNFLLPRAIEGGGEPLVKIFTGAKFASVNHLMGTMGDTISFGYLMLVGFIISLFSRKDSASIYFSKLSFFLVLIYLTGSRAVTLVAVLVALFYYLSRGDIAQKTIRALSWFLIVYCASGLFLIFASTLLFGQSNESFFYILTPGYIELAMNQRLGIVFYILPFSLLKTNALFGFGPDKYHFAELVASANTDLSAVLLRVLPNVLEDVYWIALVVYYGLIGVSLWIFFLRKIYLRIEREPHPSCVTRHNISSAAIYLLASSVLLCFFNQAYEARSFSFYLWLLIGLALVQRRQAERHSIREPHH